MTQTCLMILLSRWRCGVVHVPRSKAIHKLLRARGDVIGRPSVWLGIMWMRIAWLESWDVGIRLPYRRLNCNMWHRIGKATRKLCALSRRSYLARTLSSTLPSIPVETNAVVARVIEAFAVEAYRFLLATMYSLVRTSSRHGWHGVRTI